MNYDTVLVWYNDKPSIRFITWYEGKWYACELPMHEVPIVCNCEPILQQSEVYVHQPDCDARRIRHDFQT